MALDVHIAVVPFTTPTSTGSMNVVADGSNGTKSLGGRTPKAVIIVGSLDTDDDNSETPGVTSILGWAVNGGNQYSFTTITADNQASTVDRRKARTLVMETINTSLTSILAVSASAWVDNGVTLNFTTLNAAAQSKRAFAILLAGNDVEAYAGFQNLGTGTNSTFDITAPGFEPDLVFLGGPMNTTDPNSSNSNDAIFCFGVSTAAGDHRAVYWGERSSISAGGQPRSALYDTASLAFFENVTGTLVYTGLADTFDSSGFTIRITGTAASQRLLYLALRVGGLGVSLTDFVAETATGNKAYTGLGFEPQFVLQAATANLSKNALASDSNEAANYSVSAFDSNISKGYSSRINPAADPTDTGELITTDAFVIGDESVVDATKASLVSLDSDGYTLDYTAVGGDATYGWALAIEKAPPPTYASRRFFL